MNTTRALFWAAYALVYDYIWDSPLTRITNDTALGVRAEPPGVAVDLGCGTGLGTAWLTGHGWDTTGVDNSAPMLARASSRGRCARVVRADAAETGLPAGCADLVLLSNVLHVHPRPDRVLAEAARLVRPGGCIVCIWPTDGATQADAFRADIKLGRSRWRSALAAVLRAAIGLPGALVGARRWSGRSVRDAVDNWAAANHYAASTGGDVMGVQSYAVVLVPIAGDTA